MCCGEKKVHPLNRGWTVLGYKQKTTVSQQCGWYRKINIKNNEGDCLLLCVVMKKKGSPD